MPIFEYRCRRCGDEFERLVFGSETASCPKCRSRSLEKQTSSFAARASSAPQPVPAPGCGRCGDPRGPGACSS